jgi:hypothetical protein
LYSAGIGQRTLWPTLKPQAAMSEANPGANLVRGISAATMCE